MIPALGRRRGVHSALDIDSNQGRGKKGGGSLKRRGKRRELYHEIRK